MLTVQDTRLAYEHRWADNRRLPCRQGWREDKAITSFHKNNIFVKTRKVMGNTDVAHYRGQLATTLSSFSNEKLGVQKLATFFKNYIFEKRRQFLNRIRAAKDSGLCPNHQTQKKHPYFYECFHTLVPSFTYLHNG